MPETTPLIKAALNLRVGAGFDVYDAVQILTDEKYNPRLLSELLSHESFHKFMTDLEIYIDGFNDKGIQIANAFLDVI